MGLKSSLFLIGPLELIGLWFGEDQRADIINAHAEKRMDCVLQMFIIALHSIMNTVGRTMYAIKKPTNMHS